jgi:hypothetical protein
MVADVRMLAERSLLALAEQCPRHYGALARTLADQRIGVRIGRERFGVVVMGGEPRVVDFMPEPTAELWCEPSVLRALLRGLCTPLRALEQGFADVRAEVEVLLVLADALKIFLAGAMRSSRHVELLERIQEERA